MSDEVKTRARELEKLQSLNKAMLEELGEYAQDYLNTLHAWLANPQDEDLRANLEAQALGLRIHVEAMEAGLEAESDLIPED